MECFLKGLHTTQPSVFSDCEIDRMEDADPIVYTFDACVAHRDALLCALERSDFRTIEELLRSLVATGISPGCLTHIAESGLGALVFELSHIDSPDLKLVAQLALLLCLVYCDCLTSMQRLADAGSRSDTPTPRL